MAELSHSEALARLDQVRQDYMKLDAKHQKMLAALRQASQCCARPSGVCFDPAVIHNDGAGCDIPRCDHKRSNRGYTSVASMHGGLDSPEGSGPEVLQ